MNSYSCHHCRKTFKTGNGCQMHINSVHRHFPCSNCHKIFKTEKSLQQHCDAVHYQTEDSDEDDSTESWRPDPPVDTPGLWVYPNDFQGRKSFGYFECSKCKGKAWFSAHAFPSYKQGCKKCETMDYPIYLWQNLSYSDEDERISRSEQDDSKPHDQDRCEACRDGVCLRRASYSYY